MGPTPQLPKPDTVEMDDEEEFLATGFEPLSQKKVHTQAHYESVPGSVSVFSYARK